MDYQEAIEVLNNHERYVGVKYVNGVEEAYVTTYFEKALNTAISAIQELQEYHKTGLSPKQVTETICELGATKRVLGHYQKLDTLEEIREAMERQQECRNCGYKIHSDGISKLNSCNDCGLSNTCEKHPEYGKYCRINCYDWSEKK